MKIRGVVLGTLQEQIDGGDPDPIDPALIKIDGDPARVSVGFDSSRLLGRTTRVWREDGRLLFEADIDGEAYLRAMGREHDPEKPDIRAEKAAIGFIGEEFRTAELAYSLEMKNALGDTVKGGRLFEIGLTGENVNKNQPPWEVIEDK
jgi:hypothetical protein